MTGDIRKQLIEALDQVEKQARAAFFAEHPGDDEWDVDKPRTSAAVRSKAGYVVVYVEDSSPDEATAAHIARWDPSTVLRLIERDRQLLADHRPVMVNLPSGNIVVEAERCTGCSMYPGDWKHPIPCPEIERAAAFWLGTPEVDR